MSPEALERVLDLYVATVRHICTVMAASNPALLVGLPLDEKYGLNPPMGGLYNDAQSMRFRNLVLDETKSFFSKVALEDDEVVQIVNYIQSLPNLTDEDLESQSENWKQLTDKFTKKNDVS
jgi:hypothetical protein